MADHNDSIFGQIARIEQQADEVLAAAGARAKELARNADDEAAEIAKQTDAAIEQAKAKLAAEYKTKTEKATAEIDAGFRKDEQNLEDARKRRFDELVEWTLSQVLKQQEPDGD